MSQKRNDREAAYMLLDYIKYRVNPPTLDRVFQWAGNDTRETQAALNYLLSKNMIIINPDKTVEVIQKA